MSADRETVQILEGLLDDPRRMQGVDRRGAWMAFEHDTERHYVREWLPGLLAHIRELERELAEARDALLDPWRVS